MSWRDQLTWADASNAQRKMASFRGAKFFVRDVDTSVGRRNVTHQYPLRDEPYIEDLGADVDEFIVNGYVVQNEDNSFDYIQQRDALISALQEEGAGTLIHPFYGEKQVNLVGKARITESFHPGGSAQFTMTFTRAGTKTQGITESTTADYQSSVDNAVEDSFDDSKDGFAGIYDPTDMSSNASNSIMEAIDSLNKMIKSVTRIVQGAGPAQVSRSLDYLSEQYTDIDLDAINETCSFSSGLIGMLNGLLSLGGMYGDIVLSQLLGACSSAVRGYNNGPWSGAKTSSPATGYIDSSISGPAELDEIFGGTLVSAFLELNQYGEETGNDNPSAYGGTIDTVLLTTPQRAQQSANLIAITNLVRNTALLNAARTAIRIDYTSYNSAVEVMDNVVEAIDDQLLKLGNDSADESYDDYNVTISDPYSYQALESLRPIFVEAMKGIGAELAKIVSYEVPPAVTSSLIVAYKEYNDLDRESEIIGRNRSLVNHPGFLPGGKTLEILSS